MQHRSNQGDPMSLASLPLDDPRWAEERLQHVRRGYDICHRQTFSIQDQHTNIPLHPSQFKPFSSQTRPPQRPVALSSPATSINPATREPRLLPEALPPAGVLSHHLNAGTIPRNMNHDTHIPIYTSSTHTPPTATPTATLRPGSSPARRDVSPPRSSMVMMNHGVYDAHHLRAPRAEPHALLRHSEVFGPCMREPADGSIEIPMSMRTLPRSTSQAVHRENPNCLTHNHSSNSGDPASRLAYRNQSVLKATDEGLTLDPHPHRGEANHIVDSGQGEPSLYHQEHYMSRVMATSKDEGQVAQRRHYPYPHTLSAESNVRTAEGLGAGPNVIAQGYGSGAYGNSGYGGDWRVEGRRHTTGPPDRLTHLRQGEERTETGGRERLPYETTSQYEQRRVATLARPLTQTGSQQSHSYQGHLQSGSGMESDGRAVPPHPHHPVVKAAGTRTGEVDYAWHLRYWQAERMMERSGKGVHGEDGYGGETDPILQRDRPVETKSKGIRTYTTSATASHLDSARGVEPQKVQSREGGESIVNVRHASVESRESMLHHGTRVGLLAPPSPPPSSKRILGPTLYSEAPRVPREPPACPRGSQGGRKGDIVSHIGETGRIVPVLHGERRHFQR